MNHIILLSSILCIIYGETINRNAVSSASTVISCTSFPCIINCNTVLSCYSASISCPSTGSGDCTINILADSAGENSKINTGTASNVELNLQAYESLWLARITAGNVNDFIVNVQDTNRAMFNSVINIQSVSGDLLFTVNGNSYHAFYSMELTVNGNIGGSAKFVENTDGNAVNANFKYSEIRINGNIGSDLFFESRIDNGNQAFDLSKCTVTGSVGRDVKMTSNTFGSFSESTYEVLNGVGGNIILLDQSTNGHSFYNSNFNFLGSIGGYVSVRDETPGTVGGRIAYSTNFKLGAVTENVEFIENGGWGRSFGHTTYEIVSVGGHLLFESRVDLGTANRQAFDVSSFTIGSVTGDLSFLSNTFGSFSECTIIVNGDIGGNVLAKDTSSFGRGFYNSFFNFYGNIGGDASFIEQSDYGVSFGSNEFDINSVGGNLLFQSVTDNGQQAFDVSTFTIGSVANDLSFLCNTFGSFSECRITVQNDIGGNVLAKDTASRGHGFYNSFFDFHGNIGGDASFIEDNNYGLSFVSNEFDIVSVNGNLLFSAMIDNNRQAFDVSRFTIGSVDGELSVLSNTFGAFSECTFNIEKVNRKTSFIGSASGGYDFYNSNMQFGVANAVDVGLVDIQITGGNHVLHSTVFDARYADEIILTCNDNSDCTDVEIKCPENNQQNKCRVYCDPNADCKNIDLFTTNGYCTDASFHCLDISGSNNCQLNYLSQVFCTIGTTYQYGARGTQCQMKKDVNTNEYYCDDIGTATCSTEAVCQPQIPTKEPSKTPTPPPTFEPCTDNTEIYNIQFVIDESGSVNSGAGNENNYQQSIDFVIDLIRYDVNANSKISALAYATVNDIIYRFTQPQNDARNAIINALIAEKSNYAAQWTDTYNGLKAGIQLFNDDSSIIDNKILILITDGIPQCGQNDNDCIADVCGSDIVLPINQISQNGIKVYIIGVGNFDSTTLNCLVDNTNNDITLINDFTSQEFKRIEQQFRHILCPGAQPEANSPIVLKKIISNNNINDKDMAKNINYKWLFVNALISVITTLFIIVLCYYIYKKYLIQNGIYSKVAVNDKEQQQDV